MKRLKNFFFLTILLAMPTILFLTHGNINCLFKKVLHISCPACGITRAIKELLKLNITSSLHYNILAIPLVMFFLISTIFLIYDTIKNTNIYIEKLFSLFNKYYSLIISLLIISMIINNITKI